MPAEFERCIRNGGRVRTVKLSRDRYMYVCYLDGKSYPGEVHHKKKRRKRKTGIRNWK